MDSERGVSTAVVVGTGTMGPGIAASLALGGIDATVVSRSASGASSGMASAVRCLEHLLDNGLISLSALHTARGRLHASSDLDTAAAEADLVIESTPEDMEHKQRLFARLDSVTRPQTVLASNTSGLSITAIASQCAHPERVVTTHFWNPAHLMPLVEIVRGGNTSPDVVNTIKAVLETCGKIPVVVNVDRPGQLGNRMQEALICEAAAIVQEGIASAEDVDLAARLGFGLRLPAYGVLEHQDIVGLDMGFRICDYVVRDLYNHPHAPEIFQQKLAAGESGAAAGKGFHDWSTKSAEEVKARRDRFLVLCLKAGVHKQ